MKNVRKKSEDQELSALRQRIRELEEILQRALAACGITELSDLWKINPVDPQYGWAHEYLIPLNVAFDKYKNKPFTPDIQKHIRSLVHATFCQLAVEGRYGVKLPNEPRRIDITEFFKKKKRPQELVYPPCEICGEDRITHDCHIIPHSEAGPNHKDNYFLLCPLHHHLFDHYRLSEVEWKILFEKSKTKMKSAQIYMTSIREKRQEFVSQKITNNQENEEDD